ncbi:MAG TPA: hypothetical protein VGG19_16655 [Tepidisphaeraceae bacterium]|jgi:hypothetical protein
MTVEQLKTEVENYRAFLKIQDGNQCLMGESGPVGMKLIDAICQVLEEQSTQIIGLQREIEVLRTRR